MAKYLRRTNRPIVGRYVETTEAEDAAIDWTLNDEQEAQLTYCGWVEIAYQYTNANGIVVRYPRTIILRNDD